MRKGVIYATGSNKMKIVTFSDMHGQQNYNLTKWFDNNPADLLIFAGDLQANQQTDYGYEFIKWFHKLKYPKKILVFGNHDGFYRKTMEYAEKKKYNEIIFLFDETTVIDGIKIFGSPHSVEFGSWWFMMKDEELADVWKNIPDDVDILITHAPPYGILDNTCDGFFTGSKTLLQRISELKNMKYHIFGHIHESYGTKAIDGKLFMNVSLLDEMYYLVNNPLIFEYETGVTITDYKTDYNVGE